MLDNTQKDAQETDEDGVDTIETEAPEQVEIAKGEDVETDLNKVAEETLERARKESEKIDAEGDNFVMLAERVEQRYEMGDESILRELKEQRNENRTKTKGLLGRLKTRIGRFMNQDIVHLDKKREPSTEAQREGIKIDFFMPTAEATLEEALKERMMHIHNTVKDKPLGTPGLRDANELINKLHDDFIKVKVFNETKTKLEELEASLEKLGDSKNTDKQRRDLQESIAYFTEKFEKYAGYMDAIQTREDSRRADERKDHIAYAQALNDELLEPALNNLKAANKEQPSAERASKIVAVEEEKARRANKLAEKKETETRQSLLEELKGKPTKELSKEHSKLIKINTTKESADATRRMEIIENILAERNNVLEILNSLTTKDGEDADPDLNELLNKCKTDINEGGTLTESLKSARYDQLKKVASALEHAGITNPIIITPVDSALGELETKKLADISETFEKLDTASLYRQLDSLKTKAGRDKTEDHRLNVIKEILLRRANKELSDIRESTQDKKDIEKEYKDELSKIASKILTKEATSPLTKEELRAVLEARKKAIEKETQEQLTRLDEQLNAQEVQEPAQPTTAEPVATEPTKPDQDATQATDKTTTPEPTAQPVITKKKTTGRIAGVRQTEQRPPQPTEEDVTKATDNKFFASLKVSQHEAAPAPNDSGVIPSAPEAKAAANALFNFDRKSDIPPAPAPAEAGAETNERPAFVQKRLDTLEEQLYSLLEANDGLVNKTLHQLKRLVEEQTINNANKKYAELEKARKGTLEEKKTWLKQSEQYDGELNNDQIDLMSEQDIDAVLEKQEPLFERRKYIASDAKRLYEGLPERGADNMPWQSIITTERARKAYVGDLIKSLTDCETGVSVGDRTTKIIASRLRAVLTQRLSEQGGLQKELAEARKRKDEETVKFLEEYNNSAADKTEPAEAPPATTEQQASLAESEMEDLYATYIGDLYKESDNIIRKTNRTADDYARLDKINGAFQYKLTRRDGVKKELADARKREDTQTINRIRLETQRPNEKKPARNEQQPVVEKRLTREDAEKVYFGKLMKAAKDLEEAENEDDVAQADMLREVMSERTNSVEQIDEELAIVEETKPNDKQTRKYLETLKASKT